MENTIINIIGQFANLKPDDINLDQTFRSIGIGSSIKLIRLHRNLEKETGMRIAAINPDTVIRDVFAGTGPISTIAVVQKKTPPPAEGTQLAKDISIGLDIEEVANLPDSEDYLNDDFYKSVFQPDEIQYALKAKNPKIHLCGMFCAKEALIKCNKAFAGMAMNQIHIGHNADGGPFVKTMPALAYNFSVKLSISHTERLATAVALCQPLE